jgi:hypothetical protein
MTIVHLVIASASLSQAPATIDPAKTDVGVIARRQAPGTTRP